MSQTQTSEETNQSRVSSERRGAVAIIGFERENAYNSFDGATRLALLETLLEVENDDAVRAVVIRGNDRSFNVGADLNEFIRDNVDGSEIKRQLENEYFPAYQAIGRMGKPVIAAVCGPAAGIGMSLALQCDLMVMADNAYLLSPFANLSLCPDGGANWLLPARMGYRAAFEAAIECQKLSAERCLEFGLVNRVVPQNEVVPNAIDWADQLSKRAPLAIKSTKRAMRSAPSLSYDEMFQLEAEIQTSNVDSRDFKEGLDAFLNKRQPQFEGK